MKNDLIKVGRRFYKECDVVMLPTEKASNIGGVRDIILNIPSPFEPIYYSKCIQRYTSKNFSNQHLYFLSDEEIKEGDWFYDKYAKKVFQLNNDHTVMSYWKKIIATTDESLVISASNINGNVIHLPRPSNEFLKKYCKLGGVSKVLVEYINNGDIDFGLTLSGFNNGIQFIPKVAPDNTITIKPTKEKTFMDTKKFEKVPLKGYEKLGLYPVYHNKIYGGREPFTIVGIRATEVELKGDYSGAFAIEQADWVNIGDCFLIKQLCPDEASLSGCQRPNIHCCGGGSIVKQHLEYWNG